MIELDPISGLFPALTICDSKGEVMAAAFGQEAAGTQEIMAMLVFWEPNSGPYIE